MKSFNRSARRYAAASLGIALALGSAAAFAQDEQTKTLEQRFEEQEQRIKVLERKLEIQAEAAAVAAAATDTPQVKAGPKGFAIQTKDGANVFKLRGLLQVDGRYYADDVAPVGADTFILRRVRPIFEGTVGGIFDFRFTPDFAGGKTIIQDAYVAARFKPWFGVTAGKFKSPFGLERLQSGADIRFVERSFATSLGTNRDLGVQFSGELFGGKATYAIAYTNGVTDGGSTETNVLPDVDNNNDKDITARVFFTPFIDSDTFALRGLGFGLGATHVVDNDSSAASPLLAAYRSPGLQTWFSYRTGASTASNEGYTLSDGKHDRLSPQFYYFAGPFGVIGEYVESEQAVRRTVGTGVDAVTRKDTLKNTAWQLAATFLVTGEDASFKTIVPKRPYAVGKPGWGALEFAARISELDVDDDAFVGGANSFANPNTRASKATEYGFGVNWYLTQNYRITANYEQTKFDGGAAGGADRDDEKVFLTRFQVAY